MSDFYRVREIQVQTVNPTITNPQNRTFRIIDSDSESDIRTASKVFSNSLRTILTTLEMEPEVKKPFLIGKKQCCIEHAQMSIELVRIRAGIHEIFLSVRDDIRIRVIHLNYLLLGVAGGTASGKSTVCKRIIEKLGQAEMNDQQRQVRRIKFQLIKNSFKSQSNNLSIDLLEIRFQNYRLCRLHS